MSVCVRRLYKMNYVLFVCFGPQFDLGSVETIMTMMIRIEATVMATIVWCGMMNVLIAAIIRTGQTIAAAIVSMSVSIATIAAISSITMSIMTISKAIDATFLGLLIVHARFQFCIRNSSSRCGSRLSNGSQAVGQAHGQSNKKALQKPNR